MFYLGGRRQHQSVAGVKPICPTPPLPATAKAIRRLTHMCSKCTILSMERLKTLQGAIAYFSDPQRAFDAAVRFRWPGGDVTCPRCGQAKHSFIKTRRLWFCYVCQKQFTVKVGTIMEDSPLGL